MSEKTRDIFKIFDGASHALSRKGSNVDQTKFSDLLSNLYSPGPSFQYIFDFSIREIIFTSKSIKGVLGENPNKFTAEAFMSRIHPNDIDHFLHCQELGFYFLFTFINKNELPNYKVSYQYRYKDFDGTYKLFLHQAIASSWDDDFKMTSSIANHSNISHITNVNNNRVSFINISDGKSYYGISNIEDLNNYPENKKIISVKELEVLNLIAEGFKSKEIAHYLNISINTVTTHRRNILQKTNFSTIPQAITFFVREGLI
ncbi:LuxR C-terminal-related transcriptional regulator [Ichthyenterobacterium sp. W332]|uniref:LuxR C-terminal-related transcriptional regulator n=1 Tax=Microcosmobacter mediterraneus TaxID=3075607 RepID=A0ABU2YL19_9FLAO|nr:LuxR C-terminal-related transcriptional regulator [Ichthyenterobacterium sp. W332]MDT0558859.1 LuxR C-terminal-related transcriptional regulator [Ichthyenterobacterium sp. W332]